MESETIRFAQVKDYPQYEVSYTGGKVYSHKSHKVLSTWIQQSNSKRYVYVKLYKDGKRRSFRVHRLVADAFVPNPDPELLTDVHHKNDDTLDNDAPNLEWCTQEYNESQKRRMRHGDT